MDQPPLVPGAAASARLSASAEPRHLDLAEALLRDVQPAETRYQHKEPIVVWKEENAGDAVCYADCSGLVDACLSHAYPQVNAEFFRAWLGRKRPPARDYYDAIADRALAIGRLRLPLTTR